MTETKFKLHNLSEIMEWPDPEWLIDGILPLGGFTQLYGKWSNGKTFVVLDWALSIATGKPWGGKHKVRQGPVLYVFGEGKAGLKQRINAWLDHNGFDRGDTKIPFRAIDIPLQLHDMKDMNRFVEEVDKQLEFNPSLIIFDTLARSIVGIDENLSKDMSLVVAGLEHLQRGYGCSTIIVHHTGHAHDRGRGSSAVPAGLDAEICTKKDPDSRVVKIECTKMKDGDEFPPMAVTLVDSQEKTPKGKPVTLVAELGGSLPVNDPLESLGKSRNGKKLLQFLVEERTNGDEYTNLRSLAIIPDGSFHRTVDKLQELGFIDHYGPFYFPTQQALTAFEKSEFN